jgi:hypothetical protein
MSPINLSSALEIYFGAAGTELCSWQVHVYFILVQLILQQESRQSIQSLKSHQIRILVNIITTT